MLLLFLLSELRPELEYAPDLLIILILQKIHCNAPYCLNILFKRWICNARELVEALKAFVGYIVIFNCYGLANAVHYEITLLLILEDWLCLGDY